MTRAHLEVWLPEGPVTVPLDGDVVTVGRASANDVVLADPATSRRHAAFQRLAGGWCVYDVGSRNGTFVNGEPVQHERPLYPGDEILVGDTVLIYRTDPGG